MHTTFKSIGLLVCLIFSGCIKQDSGYDIRVWNFSTHDQRVTFINANGEEKTIVLIPYVEGPVTDTTRFSNVGIYSKSNKGPDSPKLTDKTFREYVKQLVIEPVDSQYTLKAGIDLRNINIWEHSVSNDVFEKTLRYDLNLSNEMFVGP